MLHSTIVSRLWRYPVELKFQTFVVKISNSKPQITNEPQTAINGVALSDTVNLLLAKDKI
jgi:hypothetical protein